MANPSFSGKGSWFGGPRDGMDSGKTALGLTTATPGVAIRPGAHYESGRPYLGGYWLITAPNGKRAILRQTDIGPNQSTGRQVDVTYSALGKLGYNENNFPTDAQFKATYLGKDLAAAQKRAGNPAAAAPKVSGALPATAAPIAGAGVAEAANDQRRRLLGQYLLARRAGASGSGRGVLLQAIAGAGQVQQAETQPAAPSVSGSLGRTANAPARRTASSGSSATQGAHAGSPVVGLKPHAADHPTAGLDGYPAFDYMAKAGTAAVAPVSGTVIKLSGHDPNGGPTNGVHGPFGWSLYIKGDNGKTYFLTHMGSRTVKVGQRVSRGQKIGTVGNYAKWGGADHIHMGVRG